MRKAVERTWHPFFLLFSSLKKGVLLNRPQNMPPPGYKTVTLRETLVLALKTLATLKGYSSINEFLSAKLEVLRYA